MITNILLGAILGTILGVFLILNSKINNLLKYYSISLDILNKQSNNIQTIAEILDKLLDKFNKRALVHNEHFEIIKSLIDNNKIEIYNNQQILHNLPVRLETFIAEENNAIRKEITKQAKISSKIKSKSKQSKSINK